MRRERVGLVFDWTEGGNIGLRVGRLLCGKRRGIGLEDMEIGIFSGHAEAIGTTWE